MKRRVKLAVLLVLLGFSILVSTGGLVPSVYSWTPLEGHITQDTTLTLSDSPYRVISDVFVDDEVKFTIEPGVKVEFADGFSLTVDGSLSAAGTDGNPIVFTSSRESPSPGTWNTIVFKGSSSEQFLLKHAKVEYAVNGVTIESLGLGTIESNHICNCSETGIYIIGQSNIVINENVIEQNKNGIATDFVDIHAGITIEGNAIFSNQVRGINLDSRESDLCNVTLSSNMVSSNGEDGIYLRQIWNWGIHNVTLSFNNVSRNGRDGIHLEAGRIYNVTFLYNEVSTNGKNGICLDGGDIFDVALSSNTVSHNSEKGIYLTSYGGFNKIYDVALSSNTVSHNSEDGISLKNYGSDAYPFSWLYNVTLSFNNVSSNQENGVYFFARTHQAGLVYDLAIARNIITANGQKGIWIDNAIKANLSHNSISYNQYGVFYATTPNNLANLNDIYRNTYGMNVTGGATVDATYNYWGAPDGPYHPSVNPEGVGNPVNGDGADLDFVPWLTSPQGHINQRPTAVFSADKNTVGVNQDVTFDGSASTDDGRIDYYFFEFGDGKDSGWTTLSVVKYDYTSTSTYTASLTVVDDFGVKSTNVAAWTITVVEFITPLFVSLSLDPSSVSSEGQISVRAFVTDETDVEVEGASVHFESDGGGVFSSVSGLTDAYGDFSATFTAPTVSEKTDVRITATASKGGYADSSDYEYLSVRYWAGSYIDTYQIQVGPWPKKVAEIHVAAEDADASGTSNYVSIVEILAAGGEKISGYVPLGGSFFNTIFEEIGKAVAENPDGSYDFTALELTGDIGWFYAGSLSKGTEKEFPLSWYPIPISLFKLSNPSFFKLFFESSEPGDATELSGQENAIVNLHDPDGRLYLHVYDSKSHHVGVDYTTNQTVTDITGAFYVEWDSNTTIVLPSDVTEFRYAVDATYAHYPEENYTISIIGAKNGIITSINSLDNTIKLGEKQENNIQMLSEFTYINFMPKIIDIKMPSAISIGEQLLVEVNASDYEGIKSVFLKLLDPAGKWYEHTAGLDNGIYKFNVETAGLSVGDYEAHVEVEDVDGGKVKSVTYSLVVNPDPTVPLSVSVLVNPSTIQSGETSTVTIQVTYSGNPVEGATVTLSSDKGGTFTQTSGTTNSNGYFTTIFTAPSVTTQTTSTITASATKAGYLDGQGQTQIILAVIAFELWLMMLLVGMVVAIIVAGALVIRHRRETKVTIKEGEIEK